MQIKKSYFIQKNIYFQLLKPTKKGYDTTFENRFFKKRKEFYGKTYTK